MTREQALEIARKNRAAYIRASIEYDFGRTDKPVNDDDYGHRLGWFRVGEFNFSTEEVTGQPYDITQGGWAYI